MSFTKRVTKHFGYIIKASSGGSGSGAVTSVNGLTGDVIINKSSVGLGSVDNTSDLNKPISTAMQTALNGKQKTLIAGENVSIEEDGTISATGGGSVLPEGVITGITSMEQVKNPDEYFDIGFFLDEEGTIYQNVAKIPVEGLGNIVMQIKFSYGDFSEMRRVTITDLGAVQLDDWEALSNITTESRTTDVPTDGTLFFVERTGVNSNVVDIATNLSEPQKRYIRSDYSGFSWKSLFSENGSSSSEYRIIYGTGQKETYDPTNTNAIEDDALGVNGILSVASEHLVPNPFTGERVTAIIEILVDDIWAELPNYGYTTQTGLWISVGASATYRSDDNIKVVSGKLFFRGSSNRDLNGFDEATDYSTSSPCRLVVKKF